MPANHGLRRGDPESHWLASSLSLAECELLARVIKAVLLRSIEQGVSHSLASH